MKHFILLSIVFFFYNANAQRDTKRKDFTTTGTGTKFKFTVELIEIYTTNSNDGKYWSGLTEYFDFTEEIYGAVSVCLAATGYPPTVQLDYTYKNPVNKEIAGGVEPSPQSTLPNGRVLWRQSDSKDDRRINLNSRSSLDAEKHFKIGNKAVFIFDTKQDPQAAFRFYADMWESDPSEDDEHFNYSPLRRASIPVSEIKPGTPKLFKLYIWDSSSRHFANISITAEAIN